LERVLTDAQKRLVKRRFGATRRRPKKDSPRKRSKAKRRARRAELSPGTVGKTQPGELSPGTVGKTQPDELSPGTVANTLPDQLSPGTVGETQPDELSPGTVGKTQPDELSPGAVGKTRPDELSPGAVAECGLAATKRTRYIRAEVRGAVFARDEGRCTYGDPVTGRRCGERRFIELHHLRAYALGGEHSVAGLTLRCRAHNLLDARRVFGDEAVDRYLGPI
jgi:hypothetical protein